MPNKIIDRSNQVLWECVTKAIKDCIKAHGPITKNFCASATKRIVKEMVESIVVYPDVKKKFDQMLDEDTITNCLESYINRSMEKNKIINKLRKEKAELRRKLYLLVTSPVYCSDWMG